MAFTCLLCGPGASTPILRWHKDGFEIVECPSCGLVWRSPLPSNQEIISLYGAEYFDALQGETKGQGYQNYLAEEETIRLNANRRVKMLESLRTSSGALLDVGCAAGFFLLEAMECGWKGEGVEIAPTMVEAARKRNLTIHAGAFQDVSLSPASFDAITMWDYIEHSVDPLRDIQKVHTLLRADGLLVLSTGDIHSFMAKLSGKRWHLLTPRHHLFYFHRRTITRLLETAGFEILSIRYPADRYSIQYLAYKLRTMWDSVIIRFLSSWLADSRIGRIAVPCSLGDVMTVIARKRPA